MIRRAVLALFLAMAPGGPALAETSLCRHVWDRVSATLGALGRVTAEAVAQEGDWCLVSRPVLDIDGRYAPDWHLDRLRFRGSAPVWLVDGSVPPESLEVAVEGLRLVVQTGDAQFDWLYAAQARANTIAAEASLAWEPAARLLRLEGLRVDFPGANALDLRAVVAGVDLSSAGAMQMSATGFSLTEADLRIETHGLFEAYLLMPLGVNLLPSEGDMQAAAETLRGDLLDLVAALPEPSVSPASKAALVGELPNPAGVLTLSLRAESGIGPARLAGYALTGMPATLAEAAPLLRGVVVDVGWSHGDAP
ncbi:hypothetical protein [Rhodobacter calidifons]|uniref:General secretion pathway protein N n=1 Tax=Rhodobacter calidifons TaxID=2715277 RepID=A0ABX0G745_9RHOB|nr:hypothetical protein [Rhodobacter calidifons]NHB76693.1 hypothetical protein [Rhodobacter calidifons]